jgi:hypothetical protein
MPVAVPRAAPTVNVPPERSPAPETDPSHARKKRFTPHLMLVGLTDSLPVSPTAARALRALLWTCRKRGMGQGSAPHEAMTFLRQGGLAEAMGIRPGVDPGRSNVGSTKRALAELQAAGLVRWVRVHAWQRLPDPGSTGERFTGRSATSGCCVYYVNLDACWRGVGRPDLAQYERPSQPTGTEDADAIKFDRAMRSGTEISVPQNAANPHGTDVAPVVNCELKLTTTTGTNAHPERRPPAPGGGGGLEKVETPPPCPDLDAAHAKWLVQIGTPHGCAPHVSLAVREALRAAMCRGGLTLAMVGDVVDGATRRELGGAAYDWIHEPGRGRLFGPGLFWCDSKARVSGCVDHLLRYVAAARKRLELEASRAATAAARRSAPRGGPDERPLSGPQTVRYLALLAEGTPEPEAMRRALEIPDDGRGSGARRAPRGR